MNSQKWSANDASWGQRQALKVNCYDVTATIFATERLFVQMTRHDPTGFRQVRTRTEAVAKFLRR
jgi:hypothetical protein